MSIEPKSTTGGIENSNDLPHAPFELVESGRATKRAQHVVATIENDPQLVSDRIAAYISGEVNAEGVRHTDWSQILRYSGGRLVALSETATGALEFKWDPRKRVYHAAGFAGGEAAAGHDPEWVRDEMSPHEAGQIRCAPRFIHESEVRFLDIETEPEYELEQHPLTTLSAGSDD